jgi:hypothetical protein
MAMLNRLGGWVIAGLIVLGICYNFLLPFTPVWLDVAAWSAIGLAFLIAISSKGKATDERDKKPSA